MTLRGARSGMPLPTQPHMSDLDLDAVYEQTRWRKVSVDESGRCSGCGSRQFLCRAGPHFAALDALTAIYTARGDPKAWQYACFMIDVAPRKPEVQSSLYPN